MQDGNGNPNKAFGSTIRELRKTKGWTQEYLAFEASLDRTYISLIELGQKSPTLDTMMLISGALQTPLDEITRRMLGRMTGAPQ